MFFFIGGIGPRKKRLDDQPRLCPNCGLNQAYLNRIDHYLSVFFIPLFPVRRGEPFVECDRCGHITDETGALVAPGEDIRPDRCRRCDAILAEAFNYCPYCGQKR